MFSCFFSTAYADIVVAYPSNFPPYYVLDSHGRTVGFGLELMQAISRRTGIKFRYVSASGQDTLFNMLKTGKAQIIPGVSISDDTASYAMFTAPMEKADISIVTLKGSRINNWRDLSGKTVTATSHSRACLMLRADPSIHAECNGEFNDILYSLFSGNTNAVVLPYDSVTQVLQNLNIDDRVRIVTPPVYTVERAIAVSKQSPELYKRINAALTAYMKTDEYKELYAKWHQKPAFHMSPSTKLHTVMFVFAAALIILLVWRYFSLQKINRGLVALNNKLISTRQALSDSEERFNAMAEVVDDIIWFADSNITKLYYINNAYEKFYGKTVQSLYEDITSYTECIHPEDIKKLILHKGNIVKAQRNTKFRIINKQTGETIWAFSQYYPYRDKDGNITFVVGLVSNITDMVNAEQKMAIDQQVIAQQAKFASIGEMIGAITHQWRQPLNALYLVIQAIEDYCVEDKNTQEDKEVIAQYLKESMGLVEHMNETIDDFRDFFKQDKKREFFDAPRTVQQVLRMLTPQLKAHKINYRVSCRCNLRTFSCVNEFNPGTPPCEHMLYGIRNEFKHAVLNIVQNAKDAIILSKCADKEINIEMSVEQGLFTISVSDSAGGISNEIKDRVFDAYVTGKEDGTGMGLYLTKKIIEENMGGTITADNTEKGARFTIVLNVAKVTEKTLP